MSIDGTKQFEIYQTHWLKMFRIDLTRRDLPQVKILKKIYSKVLTKELTLSVTILVNYSNFTY